MCTKNKRNGRIEECKEEMRGKERQEERTEEDRKKSGGNATVARQTQ